MPQLAQIISVLSKSSLSPFTTTNNNGDRMLKLCAMHNLKILGTWFQHHQIYCTTWYSNTGTMSKTIYYILVSRCWRIASNCQVYHSAELGSIDHCLLAAILHLRLCRNTPLGPILHCPPNINKLHNPLFVNGSAEVLIFTTFNQPQSLEDDWNQICSILIPMLLGECHSRKKPWIPNASLDLADCCW